MGYTNMEASTKIAGASIDGDTNEILTERSLAVVGEPGSTMDFIRSDIKR